MFSLRLKLMFSGYRIGNGFADCWFFILLYRYPYRSGSKVEKGAGRISTGNEANGLGGLQSAETGVLVMTSEDNEES